MPVHHLALRTPDPDALAAFHAAALDLPELRRNHDAEGLYSVWLDLGGAILMVERGARGGEAAAGWDALLLRASPGSGEAWAARFAAAGATPDGRTGFTLYARDPDGNRFGVSSHPDPLFG